MKKSDLRLPQELFAGIYRYLIPLGICWSVFPACFYCCSAARVVMIVVVAAFLKILHARVGLWYGRRNYWGQGITTAMFRTTCNLPFIGQYQLFTV